MKIDIYAVGIVCMSVCAPKEMPKDEIERECNFYSPTGISSRWTISSDPTFKDGEPMPCICNENPERLHYLLKC